MNREQLIEALYRTYGRGDLAVTIQTAYLIRALQSGKRGACADAKVFLQRLRRQRAA